MVGHEEQLEDRKYNVGQARQYGFSSKSIGMPFWGLKKGRQVTWLKFLKYLFGCCVQNRFQGGKHKDGKRIRRFCTSPDDRGWSLGPFDTLDRGYQRGWKVVNVKQIELCGKLDVSRYRQYWPLVLLPILIFIHKLKDARIYAILCSPLQKFYDLGMPEWLSWLSICLWHRSWPQGPGLEPCIQLPAQGGSLLLPLPLPLSLPLLMLSHKSINKIFFKVLWIVLNKINETWWGSDKQF